VNFVTVQKFFNVAQAELIAGRMEAAGFTVLRHGLESALGCEGGALAVGGIRLQVPEDQAESAKAFVHDLENGPADA
jgi:hypothetical protein